MVKLGTALCVLALVAGGCNSAFGYKTGSFETIEEEITFHKTVIEDLLDESFDEYEISGLSVSVNPCEPVPQYAASTVFLIGSQSGDPEQDVEDIVEVLEARGVNVTPIPSSFYNQEYDVQIDGLVDPLRIAWGLEPEPGVLLSINGGCYGDNRIVAEDVFTLDHDEGDTSLVLRRNTG